MNTIVVSVITCILAIHVSWHLPRYLSLNTHPNAGGFITISSLSRLLLGYYQLPFPMRYVVITSNLNFNGPLFQHYTIDIIAAYYVCTHHFWSFHTLAANQDLKNASNDKNMFKRVWWWRIFVFMEGNTNPIPRVHANPITKMRRFMEKIRHWLLII